MTTSYFGLLNAFNYRFGIFESREHFFRAAVSFDQTELECTIVALLVNVGDGAH